ncbi:MAG: sugar kinase [Deltaproteobacteria bacterium]|nr:sugar kinase [Deltaproteobacteria bacterium]MBI2342159.1 sugar kinase [Deltaproteobacteria bacterium]
MSILVVGSVAYDDLETPAGIRKRALGGAAAHFAASASFFTNVRLVGVVGHDFEDEHINFFKSRNICLKGLKFVPNGKTFYWKGRYGNQLNEAENLETHLGVFADFKPSLPDEYKNSEYLFLACILPELQIDVLRQVKNPKFTACDTREFFINGEPEAVKKVMGKVDAVIINDQEARLVSGEWNLVKAAKYIRSIGPKILVIKRGEYGAALFTDSGMFCAPAMPLPEVKDPTGAGDSFAGGFMGHLARTGIVDEENLRRAVIVGSTMASFHVEDFSLDRLRTLTWAEIENRMKHFKELSHFEL